MSNMNKLPPLLSKSKSYDDWLQLVELWHKFTTLEPEKQGPAIVLSLEGEAQYHKTKSYGTQISDDVLAYRLLKSANLSTRDKQLVKATITELKYDLLKSKLIKIFSDNNDISTLDFNNMHIKTEPEYHAQSYPEVNTFTQTHLYDEDTEYQTDYINENDVEHQDEYHTLYTQNTKIPPIMKINQRTLQCNTYQSPNYQQQNYYQQSQRSHQIQTNQTNTN